MAAVGQGGAPTSFTTLGPTVDIAANGDRVESVVPDGRRMQSNGTSMASPSVVSTAAKLLAVDPTLTVAALRRLLIDSATPQGSVRLLDPKTALAMLRRRHGA